MGFDAKAYTEALRIPEVVIGGKTHTGRLLSAFEYQDALEWSKKVEDATVPREERRSVAVKTLALVFPVAVAEQLADLPGDGFWKAWAYFFTSQRPPAPENGKTP